MCVCGRRKCLGLVFGEVMHYPNHATIPRGLYPNLAGAANPWHTRGHAPHLSLEPEPSS